MAQPFEQERLLRDEEELEGTLLPTARPIVGEAADGTSTTLTATAAPESYFEYSEQYSAPPALTIVHAPSIPPYTCNTPAATLQRERETVARAQQRAVIKAEAELSEIDRAKRQVYAINYYTNAAVQAANERAKDKNRLEESGLTQTSATVPLEPVPVRAPQPAREHYPGSYGKEYEPSDYNVSEYKSVYETGDFGTSPSGYKVAEYKSIYDS